jgi:hypothetical protein
MYGQKYSSKDVNAVNPLTKEGRDILLINK